MRMAGIISRPKWGQQMFDVDGENMIAVTFRLIHADDCLS